jgi:hypothetical protein
MPIMFLLLRCLLFWCRCALVLCCVGCIVPYSAPCSVKGVDVGMGTILRKLLYNSSLIGDSVLFYLTSGFRTRACRAVWANFKYSCRPLLLYFTSCTWSVLASFSQAPGCMHYWDYSTVSSRTSSVLLRSDYNLIYCTRHSEEIKFNYIAKIRRADNSFRNQIPCGSKSSLICTAGQYITFTPLCLEGKPQNCQLTFTAHNAFFSLLLGRFTKTVGSRASRRLNSKWSYWMFTKDVLGESK